VHKSWRQTDKLFFSIVVIVKMEKCIDFSTINTVRTSQKEKPVVSNTPHPRKKTKKEKS